MAKASIGLDNCTKTVYLEMLIMTKDSLVTSFVSDHSSSLQPDVTVNVGGTMWSFAHCIKACPPCPS